MTNTNIFYIIINKLGYLKTFSAIILLIFYKSSEISFYDIILSLYLAISLRIKDRQKLLLDFEERIKQ